MGGGKRKKRHEKEKKARQWQIEQIRVKYDAN